MMIICLNFYTYQQTLPFMSLQLFHPPNLASENWSGSIDLRIIYFTFKMCIKSIHNIRFILFKLGCKEFRLFDHVRNSNHKLKRKKSKRIHK